MDCAVCSASCRIPPATRLRSCSLPRNWLTRPSFLLGSLAGAELELTLDSKSSDPEARQQLTGRMHAKDLQAECVSTGCKSTPSCDKLEATRGGASLTCLHSKS